MQIFKETKMVRKSKKISTTKFNAENLVRGVIGGIAGFVLFTAFVGALPSVSLIFFCIGSIVGLIFIGTSVWFNLRPANLIAKFIYFLSLTCYFVIIAYRGFAALLPEYSMYLGLAIVATVVFANLLPILNPKATQLIREELASPKSKFGKAIFMISIALIPIIGIPIYFMMDLFGIHGQMMGVSLGMGVIFWFVALLLPFSYRTPSSPWEKSERKSES